MRQGNHAARAQQAVTALDDCSVSLLAGRLGDEAFENDDDIFAIGCQFAHLCFAWRSPYIYQRCLLAQDVSKTHSILQTTFWLLDPTGLAFPCSPTCPLLVLCFSLCRLRLLDLPAPGCISEYEPAEVFWMRLPVRYLPRKIRRTPVLVENMLHLDLRRWSNRCLALHGGWTGREAEKETLTAHLIVSVFQTHPIARVEPFCRPRHLQLACVGEHLEIHQATCVLAKPK